ncbi:hypothetical protein C0989_004270, partial [Termitomyces sp. Mn162]
MEEDAEEELDRDEYDKITKELCQGPLLISVCQHMLYDSGIDQAETQATKCLIADKYGYTRISLKIIAYSAIQDTLSFWNQIFYSNDSTIHSNHKALTLPPLPKNNISCLKKAHQKQLCKQKEQLHGKHQDCQESQEHEEQAEVDCTKCKKKKVNVQPAKYQCMGSEKIKDSNGEGEDDIDEDSYSEDTGSCALSF